jgi:HD-GYP domain-containing protein (c-di-GMP phosphodiesterase class II)
MYTRLDYQEALLNASKGMIRVKDPVTLLKIITRFIDRQMGVTHVAVLLYDRSRDAYVLIDSKGDGGAKIPVGYIKIPKTNPIVHFFMNSDNGAFARKEALVFSELEHLRDFEILVNRREHRAIHFEDIRKHMTSLRASVCVPSFYKKELIGALILGDKLSGEPYHEEEINLFVTLANDVAMAVKNAELIKDLKTSYEKEHSLFIQTSVALATAIDARDKYTHGHSERVSHYSLVIVKELIDQGKRPFDREFMETVQLSALLHDVGKIGIKDEILNKKSGLTPDEFENMKSHVMIGVGIVKPVKGLTHLEDGILYHHERFDGKGYPMGLKGQDIPMIGRIVNVADSYDTITTARSYKPATPPQLAFEELRKCAGSQFDPEIVEAFYQAYKKGKITKREYTHFDFTKLH